ncbi:hypothetical protein [Thermoflavimicrobium dichotomicum]|uniref:Cysteine-rich KTR n=1 Tax=Thermoflavimicrobium dichotomicum TaxID=46223 RepID=A0A1I3UJ58_9BACL|nr:hypothetical protein [Thermoflavimicrobium dichotomicum]SFJ82753.1 hypothetical protein SAMN05421852_12521 [Thermoflavimicrobium dichotomicum]
MGVYFDLKFAPNYCPKCGNKISYLRNPYMLQDYMNQEPLSCLECTLGFIQVKREQVDQKVMKVFVAFHPKEK